MDNAKIAEIKQGMIEDVEAVAKKMRFGFFSILPPSSIGDEHYSMGKKAFLDENKKVITAPRNFVASVLKKGKSPDVYFSFANKYEEDEVERLRNEREKMEKERIDRAKARKIKDPNYRMPFKPSGPQEYENFYDQNKVEYEVPIDKPIDKQKRIDRENKKVITAPRGIFTNPPQAGSSYSEKKYFGSYKEDEKTLDMKAKKPKKYKGVKHDRAFFPAALEKNLPFLNDQKTFGEDEEKINQIIDHNLKNKRAPKKVNKEKGEYKKPFVPGALSAQWIEKNFKPRTGVPFVPYTKPKFVKKAFGGKPFKYNRLHKSSMFSPAITSFTSNLKSEFRSVMRK